MHIFVDADACPVVAIVENIAKKYKVPDSPCFATLIMYCSPITVR